MTPKHFAQLWTALGSVLAYYSLNALVVMQGGQALFGELLFAQVDRIESLFALFVCAPLLVVVCLSGAAHAGAVGQMNWAARLPVVWLEGLNLRSTAARWYQAFLLFAFVLGPMFCLCAFLRRFSKAVVVDVRGLEAPFQPICGLSCPQTTGHRYIVGDGLTRDMVANPNLAQMVDRRSVDWLPPLEQWLVLGLFFAAAASVLWLLWRVFRYGAIRATG